MANDGVLKGIIKKLHVSVGLPMNAFIVEYFIDSLKIVRIEFSCEQAIRIGPDILIDGIQRLILSQYPIIEVVLEDGIKKDSLFTRILDRGDFHLADIGANWTVQIPDSSYEDMHMIRHYDISVDFQIGIRIQHGSDALVNSITNRIVVHPS